MNYRLTRSTSTRAIGLRGKLDTAYSNNLDRWARYTSELSVERGVGGEPIAMTCDVNVGDVGIEPIEVKDGFWWRHWSESCRWTEVLFGRSGRLT